MNKITQNVVREDKTKWNHIDEVFYNKIKYNYN